MASGGQTGFDRLKDDKALQDHWVKRVIAYIIDVAIVSIAVYFLLLVTALPALLAVFFGQTFPFAWFWGFWLGGIAPLIVLAYFVLAEALFERTIGKEIMGLRVEGWMANASTFGTRLSETFQRLPSSFWFLTW